MKETTRLIVSEEELESAEAIRSFWSSLGKVLGQTGILVGKAVVEVGQKVGLSAKEAYEAIDPDVRRHLAQMPLVGLSVLTPRSREVKAKPDDGFRPVLFVHGLAGHPSNFAAMQLYFVTMGRKRSYSVSFGEHKDLQQMASYLCELIDEVARCNNLQDDEQIDIVAHSMGGIISRLALTRPETAQRIAHLITLGTPHQGTHLARLASTEQTVQLRPNSTVLQQLQDQEPWPDNVEMPRLIALWSPSDIMILPAEAATLEGANNIEMTNYTHFTFLLHPHGWQAVYQLLQVES